MAIYLRRLFESVLQKSDATAWVCSSDQVALAALAFLKTKKEAVPSEISVLGFDNGQDAYENQLSTYDFGFTGMAQQAMLMIMDEKSLKRRPVISEAEGFVVERRTTRR
jgi:DNA-binding LacI/PurR family transcriptional regulator